jgi:hypothetical protein
VKFAIIIPYKNDDKERTLSLLEILAQTTEHNNRFADLVIYCRFDTDFPRGDIINRLQQKFAAVHFLHSGPRYIHHLTTPDFAFPSLFWAINNYFKRKTNGHPAWEEYKSVLILSNNSCPVAKNWLEVLDKEWEENSCNCMGWWNPDNLFIGNMTDCTGYIHKEAMYSMELIKSVDAIAQQPNDPYWDMIYANILRDNGWQGTYAIRHFNRPLGTHELNEIAITCSAVLINGVPDDSVRNYFLSLQ